MLHVEAGRNQLKRIGREYVVRVRHHCLVQSTFASELMQATVNRGLALLASQVSNMTEGQNTRPANHKVLRSRSREEFASPLTAEQLEPTP